MILVNLLPSEFRPREVKKSKIPFIPIMVSLFIVFVVICLGNLFVFIQKRQELRGMTSEWESLKEKNFEAEQLQRELGTGIKSEVDFFDRVVAPPLEVARIMNEISDHVPENVWMNTLSFERGKNGVVRLALDGYSAPQKGGQGLVQIQAFVNLLKESLERYSKGIGQGQAPVYTVTLTTSSEDKFGELPKTKFSAIYTTGE